MYGVLKRVIMYKDTAIKMSFECIARAPKYISDKDKRHDIFTLLCSNATTETNILH